MVVGIVVGLAVAGVAFLARAGVRTVIELQASRGGVFHYQGHTSQLISFEAQMSVAEARAILNLQSFASERQIKQAHRLLMTLNHPDVGGSPYLASKINEAKEVLTNPPKPK